MLDVESRSMILAVHLYTGMLYFSKFTRSPIDNHRPLRYIGR